MPRINGIELITRLKNNKETSKIPILALTAYGSVVAKEALAVGASASVQKPVDFDSFLRVLKGLFRDSLPTLYPPDHGPEDSLIIPVKESIAVVNTRITEVFRKNPEALRAIDPVLFERVVADLFEEEGYEIALTPPRADGGKDIYVYKTDPLTKVMFLVECKRYVPPSKVHVAIARQLYGVVQQERASGGIIVTTSYFTKPAKEFAASVPYQLFLRDFDYIVQWLKRAK
jgi:restriction endonuclease Mrr